MFLYLKLCLGAEIALVVYSRENIFILVIIIFASSKTSIRFILVLLIQ